MKLRAVLFRWSLRVFLVGILCSVAPRLRAQEFAITGTIPVGKSPSRALITPNGREVYVTNQDEDTVSIIGLATNSVIATIPVGHHPGSLAVSQDGRRVYVGNHEGNVSVIDTVTKTAETIPTGSGPPGSAEDQQNHVRDVAITADGRRLYLAMEWSGLRVLDLATGTIRKVSGIFCPEHLAISKDSHWLYVSYQCWGPQERRWTAHDAVGVFDLTTQPERLAATFRGMPNVGGFMALSPDESQLWFEGNDACTRPDYDHIGCPVVPASIANVIRLAGLPPTTSLAFTPADGNGPILRTLPFRPEEGTGPISFTPGGELALVGGGVDLKVINTVNLEIEQFLPIANSGNAVFMPDGLHAYVPVGVKGVVAILGPPAERSRTAQMAEAALTLADILNLFQRRAETERVIALVEERGVDFPLNEVARKQLLEASHSPGLMRAITDTVLLKVLRYPQP